VLLNACHAAGFEPRISFYANDYWELQAMVSVGLGIAFAPRTAMTNKHPVVRIVSLGSTAPARRILIARRTHRGARLSRSRNAARAPRCGTHILAPRMLARPDTQGWCRCRTRRRPPSGIGTGSPVADRNPNDVKRLQRRVDGGRSPQCRGSTAITTRSVGDTPATGWCSSPALAT
jgi:LysR substrate binding domain-containing protein